MGGEEDLTAQPENGKRKLCQTQLSLILATQKRGFLPTSERVRPLLHSSFQSFLEPSSVYERPKPSPPLSLPPSINSSHLRRAISPFLFFFLLLLRSGEEEEGERGRMVAADERKRREGFFSFSEKSAQTHRNLR